MIIWIQSPISASCSDVDRRTAVNVHVNRAWH